MFCEKCGMKNEDGAAFCESCGAPLNAPVQETVTEPEQAAESNFCTSCGAVLEAGSAFCEKCGASTTVGNNPKNIKNTVFKIAVVAVIAAVVFGVISLANALFGKGPIEEIEAAIEKTLGLESAAFTVSNTSYGSTEKIKGELAIDTKDKYFCIHLDADDDGEIWLKYEDGEFDGFREDEDGDRDDLPSYLVSNIEDYIDEAFEAVHDASKKLSLSKLPDELKDEMSDFINTDDKAYDKFINDISKTKNLKKLFNYDKSREDGDTVHFFKPDLAEIVKYLAKDKSGLFTKDARDELKDIDEDEFDGIDVPKIEVHTKGGYISGFEVKIDSDKISVDITDINKTKVKYPN